jgi:hypothetical protein
MSFLVYNYPAHHYVMQEDSYLFDIDEVFNAFAQGIGLPIHRHLYIEAPGMCKGSNLAGTLRDQAVGNDIWISLWDNNQQQLAATTFDFEYNGNGNNVVGINIKTFCSTTDSPRGSGTNLMIVIKSLAFFMINSGLMSAYDNDNNSYIILNPTNDSLKFYQNNGFIHHVDNNICSFAIPVNQEHHKKYLKYKQKYLNLKNKIN